MTFQNLPKTLSFLLLSVSVSFCIKCITPPGQKEMTRQEMDDFLSDLAEYQRHVNKSSSKATYNNFDCPPLVKSIVKPRSAHKVRPGDIDLVMAVGDSLTAANGADALIITGVINQYRGLSWSGGGEYMDSDGCPNTDVTQHFTLPNALKRYNPDLKGWASGIANFEENSPDGKARLNMGIPGAKAINLTYEVHELIGELKNPEKYDWENDWKMLTMFIGGNNLCQFCVDARSTPQHYVDDIQAALDILHTGEAVPKMIVNLVTIFNIAQVAALGNEYFTCKKAHECFCYCALDTTLKSNIMLTTFNGLYRDKVWDLYLSERYDTREDFTVILQPFFEETSPPQGDGGTFDLSYFAPDCFHFSKKGHNLAGQALWNSLWEPFAQKARMWDLGDKLNCPTEEHPYIWTLQNSPRQNE